LDGKTAQDGVYVKAGQTYPASVVVKDPDGDPLTYLWDIKPESTDLKEGGDFESTPESIPGLIDHPGRAEATVTAPARSGPYRLFVYAFDGKGHAAHANIPFHVND
jgi:hypothetical protein